jgi:hypothetical protein
MPLLDNSVVRTHLRTAVTAEEVDLSLDQGTDTPRPGPSGRR